MKRSAKPRPELPVAITVAGSDSGANAGIQADLLTFAAFSVFGTTAITCLTAQNPSGVSAVEVTPAAFVREQLQQVAKFHTLRALKSGMLFTAPVVRVVAAFLDAHPRLPAVIDPVMVATSGAVLLQPEAIAAIKIRLLPRATIVTPNLDEAGVLLGRKPETPDEITEAAQTLAKKFKTAFLVKGGHLEGETVVDVLAQPRGRPTIYHGSRIADVDTHGSGCTLSAAIAAGLALGQALPDAVEAARNYLRRGLKKSLQIGRQRYIAHS